MTPAVRHLCAVDVRSMVEWISAIPFETWPQQTRLEDGRIRPAMVNDPGWHGFEQAMAGVLWQVMMRTSRGGVAPGGQPRNHMLSVVMPGHSIPPHADQQSPGWVTRVHVPLLTNPGAKFIFQDEGGIFYGPYRMEKGSAYLVDVTRVHEVRNEGDTPRIHFMFDVFGGA